MQVQVQVRPSRLYVQYFRFDLTLEPCQSVGLPGLIEVRIFIKRREIAAKWPLEQC